MHEIIVTSEGEIYSPGYLDKKKEELLEKYFPDNKRSIEAFNNISNEDIIIIKKILEKGKSLLLNAYEINRLIEIIDCGRSIIPDFRNSVNDIL